MHKRRGSLASDPASRPRAPHPGIERIALVCALGLALISVSSSLGCSTRNVEDRIINRYGLDVHLRSEKKIFGRAIDRGYAQPSDITVGRLTIILGSLQIERRERARTVLGPAIPAEILSPIAQGLAEAFRLADSTQQIAVSAQRKQMQKGIFNRKFLTTLVAWMEGEDLIVHLSRSDWPIDETRKTEQPRPQVDEPQEKFRLVTNDIVRRSGRSGVAVAWRSDVFDTFSSASAARTAPVAAGATTAGGKTVLMDSTADEPLPDLAPLTNEQLRSLSSDDLRGLADLEEARGEGRITEAEYRRNRQTLIEAATAD